MPPNQQASAAANGASGPMLPRANPFFGLLPAAYAGRLKDPFVYSIDMTILTLVTATSSAQVQNDSDFVCTDLAVAVTNTDNTTFTTATTIPALVQLIDSASGRQLQSQAIAMSAWFGTAQLPFSFRVPKIFRAGGQITATVQNQASGTLIFHLTFHGFKVFPIPAT